MIKVWWKISMLKIGEKEKWRNKEMNKKQQPDSGKHYTSVHMYTNFQSSRPHSSREKCDEKCQCRKLERKKNGEIKEQISSSSLIPVYVIHLPIVHVCTKFQSSRPHSSREKCDKNFSVENGEKDKWRNKGTNKQQQPDSSIHDTSAHCPRVYQVSIFLASQLPRKAWRKILMFERSSELGDSIICLLKI